jgi:hypothetical protein
MSARLLFYWIFQNFSLIRQLEHRFLNERCGVP